MQLKFWTSDLQLRHPWRIAGGAEAAGKNVQQVVFVELRSSDGLSGWGEAAPSLRYQESPETVIQFLERVDSRRLSFEQILASMQYLNSIASGNGAAKAALNLALLDGAAKAERKPIYDYLQLGFREGRHVTSFSIGIDEPEVIRQKVAAAERFPILKLKLGSPRDKENLAALRQVAPKKLIRVDANEAWRTRQQALEQIEWLAADGHVQFVEQPMPASIPTEDWVWLRERSPLPCFADESYLSADHAARCAECFHGVNVKLVKSGGITGAFAALQAARKAGLKTMIGCMIESSLLISAGAHLAELADYLDLDGNLLISNDPFTGVSCREGLLSFSSTAEKHGMRVRPSAGS